MKTRKPAQGEGDHDHQQQVEDRRRHPCTLQDRDHAGGKRIVGSVPHRCAEQWQQGQDPHCLHQTANQDQGKQRRQPPSCMFAEHADEGAKLSEGADQSARAWVLVTRKITRIGPRCLPVSTEGSLLKCT